MSCLINFVCTWCSRWCVLLIFFRLGLLLIIFFAHACYLLRGILFMTLWPAPTDLYPPTHFARVLSWRASPHTEMLVGGEWCWLDNVQRFPLRKWLHFGDSGKSNNVLPFDFVHNPVWELHTLAAMPPSLLFSVASTTNLVRHNIFTCFVDSHKTQTLKGLAWRLNKSACNSTRIYAVCQLARTNPTNFAKGYNAKIARHCR